MIPVQAVKRILSYRKPLLKNMLISVSVTYIVLSAIRALPERMKRERSQEKERT